MVARLPSEINPNFQDSSREAWGADAGGRGNSRKENGLLPCPFPGDYLHSYNGRRNKAGRFVFSCDGSAFEAGIVCYGIRQLSWFLSSEFEPSCEDGLVVILAGLTIENFTFCKNDFPIRSDELPAFFAFDFHIRFPTTSTSFEEG